MFLRPLALEWFILKQSITTISNAKRIQVSKIDKQGKMRIANSLTATLEHYITGLQEDYLIF